MVNRPNEKDQINIIIKYLLLAYNSRLLSLPISYFRELCDCETRNEDAINNGQFKTYGEGATTSKAPNQRCMFIFICMTYLHLPCCTITP